MTTGPKFTGVDHHEKGPSCCWDERVSGETGPQLRHTMTPIRIVRALIRASFHNGVPGGREDGPTAQGDRTILIIPLSWFRPGSAAACTAELEPGTRAHASVRQRLAACPTAPART